MKNKVLNIILYVLLGILIVFVLSLMVLNIYAFIAYKDVPITELPWWVIWLL